MSKKTTDDDLIGFKDFLDGDEGKNNARSNRRFNDFELMTFLEQDSKRLTKHIETFEEKVYVIKNYPQDIKLLTDQEISLAEKKGELTTLLQRNDSPLLIHMAEIFKGFFNS